MAKKDKPKPKESGNWKPGKWTVERLRRFMRHTCKHTWQAACHLLGQEAGSNAVESFLANARDREAAAQMAHLGVRTLGDVEREATRNV